MINKGSLVAKINKVVSGEGSSSTPVVFKQGNEVLDFKSVDVEDGSIVIEVVPAKVEKKETNSDKAEGEEKDSSSEK